jgi:iron-sulfur cluster assembly protein
MLQEIETELFTITPAANKAVKDILEQRKLEGYALRVYVTGSSCCSGVSFGMALDNNIRDVDTTFNTNGIQVVVDNVSIDYLREATIDFINDPQHGPGFAVNSPNAKAHGHEHSDSESCSCGGGGCSCGGGSCSCNN